MATTARTFSKVILTAWLVASCGGQDEPRFRPARAAEEGGTTSGRPPAESSAPEDLLLSSGRRAAPSSEPIPAPPDVSAPPADAERSPSGLAWRVLVRGRGGDRPRPDDLVTVHYTGWTAAGENFDASARVGEPVTFKLSRTIAGWREGIAQMTVGERRRFWIPPHLAYEGRPGQPQGMLVFDIELVSVTPSPPEVPDQLVPPPEASRSDSGLAWKVLRPGTGWHHPGSRSGVRVHYAAWTGEGRRFDTTFERGEPAHLRLDSTIAGFAEGVRGMVEGERRRLWIPAHLGFVEGGGPEGPLVFDVELIEIFD